MAVYTVYVKSDLPADLERAVFVREGFAWGAFWLGPLWLLWRGLWLALLGWLVAAIVCAGVMPYLSTAGAVALALVVAIFFGLEGNRWRRSKLGRRGYALADVVTGRGRDAAESVFFAAAAPQPQPPAAAALPPSATPLPSHAPPVVHEPGMLGLFPDAERSR